MSKGSKSEVEYKRHILNYECSINPQNRLNIECDNIKWRDFKGFKRNERDYFEVWDWVRPEIFKGKNGKWLYVIPLFGQFVFLIHALSFVATYLLMPFYHVLRVKAYDIQDLWGVNVLVVRNKKGKYGLCFWENWMENRMLLGYHYDLIIQTYAQGYNGKYELEVCILKRNGKYGLYNKYMQKIVLECQNEFLVQTHNKELKAPVFLAVKNGEKTYYDVNGDRVRI